MSVTHLSMHVICTICDNAKATATLNHEDGSKVVVCMPCGEKKVRQTIINVRNVEDYIRTFDLPVTEKMSTSDRPQVEVTTQEIKEALEGGAESRTVSSVAIYLIRKTGYVFSYNDTKWVYRGGE